ncbi:MAG: NADH-quinone oxidoreductase subunit C [Magnetococcales bacterium]|nr:NADH-quinone oxidoreductase subunit C [Magnetococcales bacterium]
MTKEKLNTLEQLVADRFPALPRQRLPEPAEALVLRVTPDNLLATMGRLRDDPELNFTQMIDLAGVHYPGRAQPLELVYQLLSVHKNHRLRVKLAVDEETPVPSISGLWWCADWYEREAYEMIGVLFSGHTDLRRLLTEYDFEGYPLRKDFPLEGLTEVRYDEGEQRVVRQRVQRLHAHREPYQANLS